MVRRTLLKQSRIKRDEQKISKAVQINPYIMALITATFAGLFSAAGGYFVAGFQAKNAIAQKQIEYRIEAYTDFLEKTDRNQAPALRQILSIGSMADHLATDSEIQAFETRIALLLRKYDLQELYWQLNADLNILRLHGSDRTSKICDDLLMALLLRSSEVKWADYPSDIVTFHNQWKTAQENGIAYGWDECISGDERLMIIIVAKLTQILVKQLRDEIRASKT